MRMVRAVRSILVTLVFLIPISMIIGYAINPLTIIPLDGERRVLRTVRVCPSNELYHDTKLAVDEWNWAITFFSVRFIWLGLLGLRLEVVETGCDAKITLGETGERALGVTRPTANGSEAWVVTVSDKLKPEMRSAIIAHELSHVLGLLDSFTSDPRYRPATDPFGPYKVTSHDVYALYAKYVRGADGAMVSVPPYIPYMTADMPLPDIASAAVSVTLALWLDRWLRKRGGV